MNYYRNAREAELSLLAQGLGLMDGGVELDCFTDDRRSYTLKGEAFIKPSKSPEGQHTKPFKRVQLALPKTYVTRRGQMVLFTSPEDMVVGQSVRLQHRKEVTSSSAATRLKSVNKLVSSSLDYSPAKAPSSEVGEFTPVYLQRLREAAERAKEAENFQAQSMDKDENMEEDDLEGADSGVGASLRPSSSGRLSSLSHFSEGTVIQIPGDRLAEENEEEDGSSDPLKLLAGELAGHMKNDHKPKGKATKKRRTTTDSTNQKQKSSMTKTKTKKRKKTKRTAVKDTTDGDGALRGGSKTKENSSLAALEKKRREKMELERQRDEEARERARLEEELRQLRETQTSISTGDDEDDPANQDTVRETGRRGSVTTTTGRKNERMNIDSCHRKRESTGGRNLTDAEKAERAREAYEKGAKLREKQNYNNHTELNSLRLSQSITPAYTYSYFQYVPRTRGAEKSGKGTAARGVRKGQQTKRQRPPRN